jgi:hypothetical protein
MSLRKIVLGEAASWSVSDISSANIVQSILLPFYGGNLPIISNTANSCKGKELGFYLGPCNTMYRSIDVRCLESDISSAGFDANSG